MHQRLTPSRIKASTERAKSTGCDLWLSDDHGAHGDGRLVLRVSAGGVQRFYYRPPRAPGRSTAIPLGRYSRTTEAGYLTISQARDVASKLAASYYKQPFIDLARTAPQVPVVLAMTPPPTLPQPATPAPLNLSLIQMCRSYAQHLKDTGKVSAKEVSQHVERFIAPSELANQPARQITPKTFTDFLRDVISSSSGRTAAKMRTYLHAAYARALRAKLDPSAPRSQLDYGIESNPISGIDPLAQYTKPRTRYLRDSELRAAWRRIQSRMMPTIPMRGLRLCILLGGQRGEQVVSIKLPQIDLEAGTILLFDSKGRRATARQHLLPLLPQAKEEVRWLMSYAMSVNSVYLLPGSRQGTALNAGSISKEVIRIRHEMEVDGLCTEPFVFSDFRRTIETKLASLGVSKDHRAQLQSHGLSGVQNKHYDRHDYMREKRDVLQLWEGHLSTLTDHPQSSANT